MEKETITDETRVKIKEISNEAKNANDHAKLDELLSQLAELEQNESK